ncbi:hypothetical protein CGCF415_v005731 [Colletotrichum fructicola]|uniref:Uncharacterized protein n=1 Tax=Colletotrichum fructicola (strain Nara gc5) TaxID=1213859 RepID=A0A7J6IW73_COLFN|nr:hypothetical protein CGGC5_v010623 [Colletotrichum fructicola Nara gc5]KAF4896654.1 hypothetical protein CGCFRS4_v005370 [Colletotrichum fructicola]KAF4909711.1 hypothetical protein CGCF415_v005731 [Colletotrichum fructicola]KAF4937082.1 hypothetical protein CGCF245_v005913 [Colletotrichum fructicola]
MAQTPHLGTSSTISSLRGLTVVRVGVGEHAEKDNLARRRAPIETHDLALRLQVKCCLNVRSRTSSYAEDAGSQIDCCNH